MEFNTPFDKQLTYSASVYHWIKTEMKLSDSQALTLMDSSETLRLSNKGRNVTIVTNIPGVGTVEILCTANPQLIKDYLLALGYKVETTLIGWRVTTPSGKTYYMQARDLSCTCPTYTKFKSCNHIMLIKLSIMLRD